MSTGKEIRLRRILGEGRGTLIIALDQAAVMGPVSLLRRPEEAVRLVLEGSPDSLLLTRGMFRHGLQEQPPGLGLVMRVSGGFTVLEGAREFRDRMIMGVEEALRWGADGVAAAVKFGHEMEGEFIQAVSALSDACDRWGVPLVMEAMVALRGSAGLSEEEALAVTARVAAELGADVVILKYPLKGGNLVEAVEGCPVPVLVSLEASAGGVNLLELAKRAKGDGASGVVLDASALDREGATEPLPSLRDLLAGRT
ncbi:MAG: class I fructose-bisphosphate aldolase [Actinomycetota bacterium]